MITLRARPAPLAVALALLCAACCCALPTAAPARAVSQAAGAPTPGVGDPVFPALGNSGYHVEAYDLAFRYRPDTRTVDGSTTITARTDRRLTRFELDALGLDIHRVLVDGRPAAFATHDEKLLVTPADPIAAGHPLSVLVEYGADPRRALAHTGWVPTPGGFAVAGQPQSAHTVFPCNDHPSDKARFTVRITTSADTFAVANGLLTGTARTRGATPGQDTVTRTYVPLHPMATELLQVAVGDYTVRRRQGPDGLPLRDVVPPARAAALEPALALAPGQLAWLEARLGPFPLETYGLLPVDSDAPDAFDFTGLETQTLTLYKPGFLLQPEPRIGSHQMHELAHSWFGDSVTPATWADLWLNEGHADFYGLLYRYERGWTEPGGPQSLTQRMADVYRQADQWRQDSGPVAAPNAADLFDSQRYLGGALVLFALRERVGEAAFEQIERTFVQRFRDRTASTADYLAVVDEVTGQDLDGFLTAWLRGTRVPPMPGHPEWTPAPAQATAARTAGAVPRGTGTLDPPAGAAATPDIPATAG
ncbi:M1 family metallopeptidase [Kitasatospora nipponensis]|uniref:M1 family metallopeptidase n=1 Tax=Kitasatospora nipponensis TaxID=258049 RepID=UPI003CD06495